MAKPRSPAGPRRRRKRTHAVNVHLRDHGTPEWRGCKNRVLHAGALLGRLHAGHLRPAESGANHGQYPIPCGINLSAVSSRWGQRLGRKRAVDENNNLCKTKILEILRFRGFLARREGFEPPAFWSVAIPNCYPFVSVGVCLYRKSAGSAFLGLIIVPVYVRSYPFIKSRLLINCC